MTIDRDGPEWSTRRKSLNRIFLKKETVSGYEDEFNDVISDLLSRWTSLVNQGNTTPTSSSLGHCESQFKITPSPSSNILQDLERELYNWSIECEYCTLFPPSLSFPSLHHFHPVTFVVFFLSSRPSLPGTFSPGKPIFSLENENGFLLVKQRS